MAAAVVVNSKCQRVEVCNALETLLVDEEGAPRLLPPIAAALRAYPTRLLAPGAAVPADASASNASAAAGSAATRQPCDDESCAL